MPLAPSIDGCHSIATEIRHVAKFTPEIAAKEIFAAFDHGTLAAWWQIVVGAGGFAGTLRNADSRKFAIGGLRRGVRRLFAYK